MKIGTSFFKSSPRRLITSEWLFEFNSNNSNSFAKKFISNNNKGISGGHLTNKCIKLLNSQ